MKVIKIIANALLCGAFIFIAQTGFAQSDKDERVIKRDVDYVRLIKDCYVPYLNTKRLYAEGGQAYLVSPEVSEEHLYGDHGKQYLIPLFPEGVAEQGLVEAKGREYGVSREVVVKVRGKRGSWNDIDIRTMAAVGYIDKADIYIINDRVVKIIIIDMEQ